MSGFDKETKRYRAMVESSGNPVNRLMLATNTPEAQAYLYQRALEALDGKIPFEVRFTP